MRQRFAGRRILEKEAASLLAKPRKHLRERLHSAIHPFFGRLDSRCLAMIGATAREIYDQKGTVLFAEEQSPDRVYLILEGQVRLCVSSPHGKSLVLGFFGPGTVLGLESVILGLPHIASAEVIKPTKTAFMARRDVLRYLGTNHQASLEATEMVSQTCRFLLGKIKAIELAKSAEEKLVRFLLGIHPEDPDSTGQEGFKVELSQEAIAQMIGISRETVARLLARLKRRGVLDWRRSVVLIPDRRALEELVQI